MKKVWWKEAVAYQVYPRSFMDSNGDGIGDLRGIMSKLDYLKDLGVDVIWISPVYESPNDDNGYDISDYKAILADFGTMNDFDELLAEIHARGMKVIMDLVINHTSDEHPWFIESQSSKDNPYRDYYIWREGKDGGAPNNWESIFNGPAWAYDEKTGEYYMHIFSKKQPDLNWENEAVRRDLYEIVNWWLDKGIDGFRVDAISHIKKLPGLPDLPNPDNLPYVSSFAGHMNQEGIQPFLRELRDETYGKYDVMTVGEANGVKIEDAEEWVGEKEGKFNMVFQFEHLDLWGTSTDGGIDIEALRTTFEKWQNGLHNRGWNALFLENHDQPRSVSTWGNSETYWSQSAKALATFYFLMQGTPFIYQGQEIGMTNVRWENIADYNDVAIRNLYQEKRAAGVPHDEVMEVIWKNGRDNSRTPMQWDMTANSGFTTGKPWLKVNENYETINVASQLEDPNSIYNFYRKLISLRKEHEAFVYGDFSLLLRTNPYIFAYEREYNGEVFVVLVNLFAKEATYELTEKYANHQVLLSNMTEDTTYEHLSNKLSPYEAVVFRVTD